MHVVGIGNVPQHFTCYRCDRTLPETQFARVHFTVQNQYLHPWCNTCRKQARSTWTHNPLYTPALHRFAIGTLQRMKSGARKRGLVIGIDADDILAMFVKQKGRCAISGKRMTYTPRGQRAGHQGRIVRTHLSVDRIRSDGNYTRENCQLVCAIVNIMKHDMIMDELRLWCAAIILMQNDEIAEEEAVQKELDFTPEVRIDFSARVENSD